MSRIKRTLILHRNITLRGSVNGLSFCRYHLLSFPCTYNSLKRRGKELGLDTNEQEWNSLVEQLFKDGYIYVDGVIETPENEETGFDPLSPPVPGMASIHVTNKCNLRCGYCYNKSFRRSKQSQMELNSKQWTTVLNNMADAGVVHFSVTGGEPLLRMDLMPVFSAMRSKKYGMYLISNGTLFDENNIAQIKEAFTSITISVDSHEPVVQDELRGSGSFEKIVRSIELLVKNGITVNANLILSKLSIDNFSKSKKFFRNLGCSNVIPIRLQATNKHINKFKPSKLQLELFFDKQYVELSYECSYRELIRNTKMGWVGQKMMTCGAANAECAVGADGTLYPCRIFTIDDFAAGSLLENSFETLWYNAPALRRIREIDYSSIEHCSTCGLFQLCVGGCRGNAYQEFGKLNAWPGEDLCHEHKQAIAKKLQVALKAKKEEMQNE